MAPPSKKIPSLRAVRDFWDQHPLCSHLINSEPGTKGFFQEFDHMRAAIEPDDFVEIMLGPSQACGKQVLDVGCGNGYMLAKFAQNGAQVSGVDLSRRAVDITRKRMELFDLNATVIQADVR
jgi:2-polyprenyl-3-methyl-5-hydroxy-6-metoxy-1,4-benzoquinol methylase